ncbi:uncharacterized protein [Ptychodera flava]|uniref:uncharacterized protein n=1 Tax=Ptychodera flava TaxID=63121 RepID=UPI003969D57F
MDPSKPVCSDGVTVDDTEPTLREVFIDDVFVTPSLVKDANGAVWFINENRYRQLVQNPSDHCRNVASFDISVDLYPQKLLVNNSEIRMEDNDCTSYGNVAGQAFIRRENHIFLTWEGNDADSGIFDYEVGIGKTSAGLDPDIVPFTSTKGHQEFQTYHPNLGEGVEFYISIKATNRAGLAKIETIGPFFVDVTPPSFQGDITVTSERDENKEFLVARWNTGSFYDDDQLDTLKKYEVALGDNEGETNVMSYVSISNLQSSVCQTTTPPTCAAIPTDILDWNLHGDHVYFMSIKVTNVAGLSVVATSNPYYHVVQLPSTGNVYETSSTNEDALFGVQEDIDLQVDVNNIHCRWSGFSHPHQVINYELGLGTSPDLANIVPFHSVGSDVTSYSFQDLTLVIYQKYYVIVKASTQTGTVTASSDGVTVLANEETLTDAHVYDGLPCTLKSGMYEETTSHHAYNRRSMACLQDVDFQASTSTAGAHWVLQDHVKEYASHAEWALQRKQVVNSSIIAWDTVTHYRKIESASFYRAADILLLPGQHYRSVVKFCFQGGCFQPVASDGFWVTPFPPIPGEILEISHSNLTDTISIRWNAFEQDELTEDTDEEAIDYYEWSLSVASRQQGEIHDDVLFPWQRINVTESSDKLLDYSIQTPYPIDFSKCIQLGLRGYNKAGLYTTIYRDIQDCKVRSQNLVIDSVGDYDQSLGDVRDVAVQENSIWLESDREYTRSHHKLSAVWPTLQHGNFSWKVVSDQTLNHLAYHRQSNGLDFYTYECSAPEILACGQSSVNYVNVGNLDLKHGWRYYICVHANQTTKIYGNTQTLLPEVVACSNGIVADHTPPNAGRAWIGWKEQLYQASSTDLVVNWNGFYDVEEHGRTSHSSGIRRYEVAVGTSPGGVDVQDFQSVGVANWINLYNLNLISGQTYYATVRAIDFVGLSTDVVSSGVTVDTSPPLKSEQSINVGGPFITSKSFISAEWKQLFSDEESGVSYYEWCIGSKPGYADVFPCTSTNQEQITLQADDGEPNMVDGHIYYAMVKAYNGAGLSTVGVSWALLYDTSPPEAGYVYDGCDQSKDSDYQIQLDYLCAQWHGFRDPHCAIKGYSWKIGSCPGCHDVVAEENLGLKTAMNANYLQLEPGTRYYTTIRACNVAGLCTSVSSDGIIPDNSPPVAGNVYDGINDGDVAFQSSKTTLTAHWYNFHDPHSQLSHYEVRAGTSVGSGDVLSNTRLHLTEKIFTSTLLQSMPMNRPVYVTVRAYNKAGLFVEQSSNGVTVDETPPIVTNIPTIDNSIGSFTGNTQVWRSLLRVSWEFRDSESPLQYYLLSVFTHHRSENPAPTVKLPGSFRQYTFTNLTMHDGDSYYVKVIGCNAAKLCTSSESTGVLIDSSPPTVGTFAVGTDHAAGLTRHRDGWMTYQQSQGGTPASVNLAWLGFSDIHSGISHYRVAVGSQFGVWDLTQNQAVEIINQDGVPHFDEGVIQTASVDIVRNLVPGEHIYCTIWAINGVGQRGYEAQESFTITRFNGRAEFFPC